MSRFWDVLRAAGHSQEGALEEVKNMEWEVAPPSAVEIPSQDDAAGAAAPQSAAPEMNFPGEDLFPSISVPQSAPLGTPATLTLDRKARLLPHAVNPALLEYYRKLRTKVLQVRELKPFRSLVVTSPGPQEGKTVTVINLGLSFAALPSFKVLILDGDLRRGSLGKWLGLDDRRGLTNVIDGSAKLEDVVLKCERNGIYCIPRGNSPAPPAELLHSPQLNRHFRRLAEEFDLVLVDSPPVNLISDVQRLAASCDAVLLIARAFTTTRRALEKAVQDLAPFRMIGAVLNGGTRTSGTYHYRSYYSRPE